MTQQDVDFRSHSTTDLRQPVDNEHNSNCNNYSDGDGDDYSEENYGHETDAASPISTTNIDDSENADGDRTTLNYTNSKTSQLPIVSPAAEKSVDTDTPVPVHNKPNIVLLNNNDINRHINISQDKTQIHQVNIKTQNQPSTQHRPHTADKNNVREIFRQDKASERQNIPINPVYHAQYVSDGAEHLQTPVFGVTVASPRVISPEQSYYRTTATGDFDQYLTPSFRYYANIAPGERYLVPHVTTVDATMTTKPPFEYYRDHVMDDTIWCTSDDDIYVDANLIEDPHRQFTRILQHGTSLEHHQPEHNVVHNIIRKRTPLDDQVLKQTPIPNIYQQPPPSQVPIRARGGGGVGGGGGGVSSADGRIVTSKHYHHLYSSDVVNATTPSPMSSLVQTSHVPGTLKGENVICSLPTAGATMIHHVPHRVRNRATTIPTALAPRYYRRDALLSSNGATTGINKPSSKLCLPVLCQPEWQTLISSSRKQRHPLPHRASLLYQPPAHFAAAASATASGSVGDGTTHQRMQHQQNPFVVANNEGNLAESSPRGVMRSTSELEALLTHYEKLFQSKEYNTAEKSPRQETEKSKSVTHKRRRKKNIISSYVQTSRASSATGIKDDYLKKKLTKKLSKTNIVKDSESNSSVQTTQKIIEQNIANNNLIKNLSKNQPSPQLTKPTTEEYSKNESLSKSIDNLLADLMSSDCHIHPGDSKTSVNNVENQSSNLKIYDNVESNHSISIAQTSTTSKSLINEINTNNSGVTYPKKTLSNHKTSLNKTTIQVQPEKLEISKYNLTETKSPDTPTIIKETQTASNQNKSQLNTETVNSKIESTPKPNEKHSNETTRSITENKSKEKLFSAIQHHDISTTIAGMVDKFTNKINDHQIATELHHSKSYIIKLIDRALSKELGTAPDSAYASPKLPSPQAGTCSSKLAEAESEIFSKITAALNETLHSQLHNQNQTKSMVSELLLCSEEPSYIKQLKKLRWDQLKHIQQEIRRLEDLERFLDSCSSTGSLYFQPTSNTNL